MFCELLFPIKNVANVIILESDIPEVVHHLNLRQLFLNDDVDLATFATIFHLHKISPTHLISLFTLTSFFKLCKPISPQQLLLFNININISKVISTSLFRNFDISYNWNYNHINADIVGGYDGKGLDTNVTLDNKIDTTIWLLNDYSENISDLWTEILINHIGAFSELIATEWALNFDWDNLPEGHNAYSFNRLLYRLSFDYISTIYTLQLGMSENIYTYNLQYNYIDYVDLALMVI